MRLGLILFLLCSFSALAQSKPYQIEAQLSGEKLRVSLQVEKPARINPEAPVALTLNTTAITFKKTGFSRHDATGSENALVFELQGTRSGRHSACIDGHLSFFLCTEKTCKKIEEDFTVHQPLDQENRG